MQFIEEVNLAQQLESPIAAIGLSENTDVLLELNNKKVNIDLDSLVISEPLKAASQSIINWSQPQPLPEQLTTLTIASEITLERFILDLHSGRAIGGWGVWLIDAVALCLILLIVSGYLSWRERHKDTSEKDSN